MSLPITVILPVKNEESHLPDCLRAIGNHFAEVVVVDSGSTDHTCRIADEAGVKVLKFAWDGGFPKKRNWVLQNHNFRTRWVLFLDADELVTQAFIDELHRVLPTTTHVGFWISFTNWFLGQPLRHGDVFRKLALFQIGAGEYERFPEQLWSNLDMEVHEHPVLNGTLGDIHSKLDHDLYRGLHHYLDKHNEYSTWEANRYHWLRSAPPTERDKLTPRQKFKYRNLDRWWLAWIYFIASYLLKRGFLDGSAGWHFNWLKKRYFHDIRAKIRESSLARRSAPPSLKRSCPFS